MRFLADMGVARTIVAWLQHQGHDATHLQEQGLERLEDRDIFAKAAAENRILLTFDLDFGEIVAFSSDLRVSVVLFRLRNARTPHVLDRLRQCLAVCGAALGGGVIVVVDDSRLRIRRLPIGG